MEKIKPKLNAFTLIMAACRVFNQKRCPLCRSIEPYYQDCVVCEGYVIGCQYMKERDVLIKWIAVCED